MPDSQAAIQSPDNSPQQVLASVFGYDSFRPGQEDIIRAVLAGQDALVIMPTGGGKSLCYQVPALCRDGTAIVVSPLISLMKDQVDQLLANGVRASCLNSAMDREQVIATYNALHRGELDLLYVAPERLLQPDFLARMEELKLSLIAIDEAHCISAWGHDFRPEYLALGELKARFPYVPLMALTATADKATRHDILQRLNLGTPFEHLASFDRPNIRYLVAEKFKPISQLVQYLQGQKGNSGIIYAGSRKRVDDIAHKLRGQGFNAAAYHAGMSNQERQFVQESFQRDEVDIVVATVAFGMGINKPDVRFVVHFDLPKNIESYYQETGRAGRDGLPAEAWMLFEPGDVGRVRSLIELSENEDQQRVELSKLHAIAGFAEGLTCRRQVLLNYFGEYSGNRCGNCDICLDPPQSFDGTEPAQKAMSTIYRTGQRFGVGHVVEVLRGSQNARLKELGHDQLSTWGLGKDHSHEYWVSVIRQLIHHGLVMQDITRHSALTLTEAARPVLRGDKPLTLAVPRVSSSLRKSSRQSTASPADKVLFARLKKLRKQLADELGVPPYVVFNDATLAEMATHMPTTESELLAISGVGQTKLARYGEPFLELIGNYLNQAS
ncbi:DNA helicase RecQ [Gallaecimonas sp. GXIMD4217]|uniref:DNA helicase RecQ n=1 Tax=Gallaecimonas sp. GXIMD4217 TaxID=3131927 RepID=UPI00311AC1DA